MSYPQIDLTNCDKEPIHILGKVQAHGFLIAADKDSFLIKYASDNLDFFTGIAYTDVLDKDLSFFLDTISKESNEHTLLQVVKFGLQSDLEALNPLRVEVGNNLYNLVLSRSGNCVILEFEPTSSDVDRQLQMLVGSSLSKILEGNTLEQTLDRAAKQIKELIGYDRVMIYKFWEDGHGEVVAEQKNEELEPFFGLHYPASDIPKQARELYKINLTRIIADVEAVPSDIYTLPDSPTSNPLDLTHSVLRAVSSIHIQYLKNMGVGASFSVSLMSNDELWGLIACHNYSSRFIDYKARQHARLIGQVLSSSIQYRSSQDNKEINISYRNAADEIIRQMHKDWSVEGALNTQKNNLLKMTSATGVAIRFEGKTFLAGDTPSQENIYGLVEWLKQNNKRNIFHTTHLGEHYAPANDWSNKASGLLACTISKELAEYVLFFKPELVTTVKWAGNPQKSVEIDEKGQSTLSPRRSFDTWVQEVTGTSDKWSKSELNAVFKFREDFVHFINLKSNEIRKLNEKLQEAYDELDTFSFTISHDLKTPIASVKNYAEILIEDNPQLDEQARHFLNRIINSADNMNALIREVLGYSRVSRQEINRQELDMKPLLEELKTDLLYAFKSPDIQFTISGTPPVKGDRVMITQVFSNLLGNAIKYSSRSNPQIVSVGGREEGNQVIYTITDNGVGIDMNYGGHIFELFKRMDNVKDYEGSGVGLAIVKRIMEKHNARIWYESEPGNGTIFYLSFQKD